MSKSDWFIAGAAILAGYALYRYFAAPDIKSAENTLRDTADEYKPSTITSGYSVATYGDTTYRFSPEDLESLNFAQRLFLQADKIVPGNWLTGWVFGK